MGEAALTQEFGRWSGIVSHLSYSAREQIASIKGAIEDEYVVHAFQEAAHGGKRSADCLERFDIHGCLRFDELDIDQFAELIKNNSTHPHAFEYLQTLLPAYISNMKKVRKYVDKEIPIRARGGGFLVYSVFKGLEHIAGISMPSVDPIVDLIFVLNIPVSILLLLSEGNIYKSLIDKGQAADFERDVIRAITCDLLAGKYNEMQNRSASPALG